MDFLTSVNMHQNELQNFSIQKLGAAPGSPVLGQLYMDADGSGLHIFTSKGWSNFNTGSVDTSSTAPSSPTSGQVYYNSTDKRFYFYDGSAWVGLVTVTELNLKAPKASPAFTGTATITSAVTKASGSATDVFTVKSSDAQELFKVKGNGDTVIGGLLTVNGTGTSTFAGDVTIGGHLTVEQDATVTLGLSGSSMTLTGDLAVQGNTTLGDNAASDTTTIKGVTTIKSDATKATGSASVDIFKVVDSADTPLFEVRKNGDAVIGGILTVNGTGTSTFAGDVSINGNLTVDKSATVIAAMAGQDLTLSGNLVVNGNTTLGDASTDTLLIKAKPTVQSAVLKANGNATDDAFSVVDSSGTTHLFDVKTNGDAVIGGILTVSGTGTSTFAGDVSIGGKLTVADTATATAAIAGTDLTLTGNLVVKGNTTLGDATGDTTTVIGTVVLPSTTSIGTVSSTEIGYLDGVTSAIQTQIDNKVAKNANITAGTATKITYDAKGLVTAGTSLAASDIPTLTSAKISDLATTVKAYKLNEFAAPTAAVSMGSQKITDLAAPTLGSDAVTKDYADALRAGISVKDPVRVASTTNVAIATGGLLTIDGVTVAAGNRVLLKNQTTASENGIYVAGSGAWVRSTDADNTPGSEVVAGMAVWVNEGTTNADSRWVLTTNDSITLGSTALTFTKDFQAADIVAGTGLTKTGSTLNVVGTANRITANADGIDIASTYAGQTSITTLGTITAGTWNASTIAVAKGGTGATTAAAARTNLGAAGKYAADIGDGSATTIDVIHNLGSLDVVVQLKDKNSPANMVMCDVQYKDANTVTLLFGTAPTSAQYRVVIIG